MQRPRAFVRIAATCAVQDLMATIGSVLRLTLAAVFAVAGAANLADLRGSRLAIEAFELPDQPALNGA